MQTKTLIILAILATLVKAENLKFFLITESCWNKLLSIDFSMQCVVSTVVQMLNIMNLTVVFFYRVPQIKKLIHNKSAVGISYNSLMFELTSLLCTLSYYYIQGYSLMAYGENFINFFQLFIVFTLVYKYNGMTANQFKIGALYCGVFFSLLLTKMLSIAVAKFCLTLAVISFIFSKVTQMQEIFKTQYSRNLSLITLVISPIGIGSRLLTSFVNLRHDTFLLV